MLCPHRRTVARLALEAACLEPHLELAVVLGVVCVVLALRHRCDRQRARWGLPCDCLGAPPACFCHHAVVPLRSRRASAASAAEGGPRLRESRLAAFAGCPPLGLIAGAATGPCRGRPRSSRSCEPGCVRCAARRDRRPPDSVLRGLRRRVGGRALGGDRHLSALLCFSLVRPWTCADLLSPPALLCHVAVCVWVSMFAIWILDFLRLFVYLFTGHGTGAHWR